MQGMVTVLVCNTRIEAEIIRGKLQSEGIQSFLSADDAGGMYPFPMQAGFTGVAIFVAKKDFLKAKKVLKIDK